MGEEEEAVQAEVSSRVEALWAVVRRLLHEVKLRPLVCVLVIHSFFCPALLALPWLSSTPEAPLRRLWHELQQLAMEDKHHILVNLVARCIAYVGPPATYSQCQLMRRRARLSARLEPVTCWFAGACGSRLSCSRPLVVACVSRAACGSRSL